MIDGMSHAPSPLISQKHVRQEVGYSSYAMTLSGPSIHIRAILWNGIATPCNFIITG